MFRTRRICWSKRTVVLAGPLLGFLTALPAFGSTVTVTDTNDSGPGSLRDAIAISAPGDTIDFGVTGTITLSSTLVIDKNLTISGPGAASLSVSGNNSVVVFITAYNTNVTVSGLTVTGGFNAYQGGWGAGIVNLGSLTAIDCVITGNRIPAGGGPGGGIFNYSSLKLINSTVSGNSAAYGGGGVWNNGNAWLEITDSTISANSAVGDGGGVSNVNGTMTITRTLVSGNSSQSSGGGLSNYGTLTLVDSTVSGNSNNGIFNWGGSTLTITGSTVSGNSSVGWGGGLNSWGTVTINNSTFASNTAATGGGIFAYAGVMAVSHSTFAGNRSTQAAPPFGLPTTIASGGGIWNSSVLTLKNTVMADSGNGGNCGGFSGRSAGYNLSDDNSCSSFFIQPGDLNGTPAGLDPAGLQNNGGATKTFALVSSSPALNAIPVSACTDVNSLPVTTDQRGISRPQGSACDMGSFEMITANDTTPPSFSGVPANQSLEATGPGGASATWTDPTASDIVSGSVTVSCSHTSGSTFPLGTTTVTCSASDEAGNSSSASFSITVQDTTAPALTLPASQVVEATGPSGAAATWLGPTAVDLVSGVLPVACSHASGATFPLGTTTVSCSVSDAAGNPAAGTFTVTVVDTTAPAIASVTPSSRVLWPPNHQLVPLSVTVQASDAVSSPVCTITGVTSSEPDNGLGDGDTPNDIQGVSGLNVQLRAERSGRGTGRTYAIAISCVDAAGNATQSSTTVTVPQGQRR